jgi:GT2 family glycosyltransferase
MTQVPTGLACEAVIVNYNAGSVLVESVRSILACPAMREVIVVDNHSNDNSLEQLEAAFPGEPRLRILRGQSNLGFAGGCNTALPFFQSPYQLFINPDCLVEPQAIGTLIATLEADSKAGMAGPLLSNTDGSEQAGGRRGVPTPGVPSCAPLACRGSATATRACFPIS